MKKTSFCLLFLAIGFIKLFCQATPMPDTPMIDRVAVTALYLSKDTIIGGKSQRKIGRGFLVSKSDADLYIVTATHVSKEMGKTAMITIQGSDNKPIQFKITDFAATMKWINHPIADLSVLKLTCSNKFISEHLSRRFLPLSMIDSTEKPISRGRLLTVFGFPLGLGTSGYFSPLSYRSYPSSALVTFNRFDINTPQTFIILENPSVGGYSGGPVFDLGEIQQGILTFGTSIGGPRLTGIIHGTIDGKLTAMTPAFYLRDLIK